MLSAEDTERAESLAVSVSDFSGGSPERVESPRSRSRSRSPSVSVSNASREAEGADGDTMESMDDPTVKSKMEESSTAQTEVNQPAEKSLLIYDIDVETDARNETNDEDKKEPKRKRVRLKSARSTSKTRSRTEPERHITTVDDMLAQKYSELKILLSNDGTALKSSSIERKSFPYHEAHENSIKLSQRDGAKRVRRRTSSKLPNVKNEPESAAPSENLPPRRVFRQRRATSASLNQLANGDQLVEGVNFPSAKSALVRQATSASHAHKEAAFYDAISKQSHEETSKSTGTKWHYRPVPSRPIADPDQRAEINRLREKHREAKAADFLNVQRQRALRESMLAAEQRELAEKAERKLLRLRSTQAKRQLAQPTLTQPRQLNLVQQRASYQAWLVQYRDEVQERQDADEEEKQLRKADAQAMVDLDDDLLRVHPESARIRMQKHRARVRSAQRTKSETVQLAVQNHDDE